MPENVTLSHQNGRWVHPDGREVLPEVDIPEGSNRREEEGERDPLRENSDDQQGTGSNEDDEDEGSQMDQDLRDRLRRNRHGGDERSRTISSGSQGDRRSHRSDSRFRLRRNWIQPRESRHEPRRERGRRSRSRNDSRRGSGRAESRRSKDEPRRERRRRSHSVREGREQREGRRENANRQEQPEVSQIKKDLASVSYNLNVLKASSESATLPPMVLKAHQAQIEHNVIIKNILVHEMKTELARSFQNEVPPILMEIIKKGEQRIDKRNKLVRMASRQRI